MQADGNSLGHVLDVPSDEVTADDLNNLRDAVMVLLVRHGFDSEWEPNIFGQECEDLIDRLAPWHWGRDD